jgi:flagellar hook-associated protein 1 FlgK
MSLDASLSIASNALANIGYGYGVISQNVANASTVGYATEQATQTSIDGNGIGLGVRAGPTRLATDQALQAALYGENANASGAATTAAALASLQVSLGGVGQGNDLGSALGQVQSAFSALLNDPSSQPQQLAVVGAAQGLAANINALSSAYGQARQNAQDGLVAGVTALNAALGQVGAISNQIISLRAQGASTADLENQRNQQLSVIAGLVDTRFAEQPNGELLVFTTGGAQLPTHAANPLSIAAANTGPGVFYPGGGLPGILLGGADVTGALRGGSIGAQSTLRDTTLPTYQGELDEFAQNTASRFDAQGLTLFTDPTGTLPAAGGIPAQANYLGFAGSITVNPVVIGNPALVRDGDHAVAGSPTGASAFTPNPNGQAGFADLINRVLNFALGTDAQSGVPQPGATVAGLGAAGTLAAPFGPPGTPADFATAITASQSADSAAATTEAGDAAGAQGSLAANLKSETGVNVDSQLSLMIQLQNAYGANAKIISTVQSMFTTLLQAIQ